MVCEFEKSCIRPSLVPIPVCPIKGNTHVMMGIGVHVMQRGYLSFLTSYYVRITLLVSEGSAVVRDGL